jgi:hypothetical protein
MTKFAKGHGGLKKPGTRHKPVDPMRKAALLLAKKQGDGSIDKPLKGLEAYLSDNPALHQKILLECLTTRARLDDPKTVNSRAPQVGSIDIISIPRGWVIAGVLGYDCHLPFELLEELKSVLPPGSIGTPPSVLAQQARTDSGPSPTNGGRENGSAPVWLDEGPELEPDPPPAA